MDGPVFGPLPIYEKSEPSLQRDPPRPPTIEVARERQLAWAAAPSYVFDVERVHAARTNRLGQVGTRVYVRNFAIGTTEESVRMAFAPAGRVREVRIIVDRVTGRPRGFAFVTMGSHAEATRAAAMNGTLLEGRPLRVSLDRRVAGAGSGSSSG